ncbi:MAG: (Fe-S)-binding protein [Bacillota bacterium]|jgi:Fe-S oxidoreductase
MSLPIGPTVGLLADNLRFRGSVLPIPPVAATRWAHGLGLPHGGETVLYTGSMYQLVPYIASMGRFQERLAGSRLARYAGLGRAANRVVSVSSLIARPGAGGGAAYDRNLRNIARLLGLAGLRPGYLYGEELYSGALVHDLGVDGVFAAHARRVHDLFVRRGVRRVITVDPHTTYMLAVVYPRLVSGYDLRVESYLEVLAQAGLEPRRRLTEEVALHDSCLYARSLGLTGEPRRLLGRAGLTVREPEFAGRFTWCCGGPIEALYPKKALEGARTRVDQLRRAAARVVTMCPICLVNLRRAAPDDLAVTDISDYLAEAYAEKTCATEACTREDNAGEEQHDG